MILITGATGTSGSEIVKQLVAKTVAVRALVRNPEKAKWLLELGVEIVQGDFSDPDKLKTALKGVEKALMLPPIDPNAVDWQSNFIEATKSSNTKYVVKFLCKCLSRAIQGIPDKLGSIRVGGGCG